MSDKTAVENVAWALQASADEVGPACARVDVPRTIDMTDDFRDAYSQGYRHAIADVRMHLELVALKRK